MMATGRARLMIGAAEWRDLPATERRSAHAALARAGVTWTKLRNATGDVIAHRSSPLAVVVALRLQARMGDAATLHAVHTHAHLAAVILGGRRVVMGAGSPMVDARDAETRGTPVAVVVRGEVVAYGEAVYGHTDAELLAAALYERERATAGGVR